MIDPAAHWKLFSSAERRDLMQELSVALPPAQWSVTLDFRGLSPTHPTHHPHTSPHVIPAHPHVIPAHPHVIPAHPHVIPAHPPPHHPCTSPHVIPCIISSTSRTEFSRLEFSWIISCSADCHPGEGDLCSALFMLSDESFKNLRIEVQHACNLFASGGIFLSECSCQLES